MSDSFLDEMLDNPYDNESSGGTVEHIAKVRFSFAWQVGKYSDEKKSYTDTRKYFSFVPDDKRIAMYQAKEECQEYAKKEKISGFPQLGILLEIPNDTFLTAHEKLTFDINQFVNSWHSAKKQMEGKEPNLDEDQQKLVKGLLPYDMTVEALRLLKEHFNNFVWAKISQEVNWYHEAIGYRKNDDYPSRIYIVKEVLNNQAEAYDAANVDISGNTSDDFSEFGGQEEENNGLSEWAIEKGWTLEKLQGQSQNIYNAIAEASVKEGESASDHKPMEDDAAIATVCNQYAIEPSDLKLLDEAPF
jgi:hypothetical protein